MDEGSVYCDSGGGIESVSDAAKITNQKFRFRGIESKIVRRHPR